MSNLVTSMLDSWCHDDINLYQELQENKQTDNIMKTTSQTTQSFPETSRFIIYVFAVAVFCFFNWMVLQAQGQGKDAEIRLAAALFEEVEPEIEVAK